MIFKFQYKNAPTEMLKYIFLSMFYLCTVKIKTIYGIIYNQTNISKISLILIRFKKVNKII